MNKIIVAWVMLPFLVVISACNLGGGEKSKHSEPTGSVQIGIASGGQGSLEFAEASGICQILSQLKTKETIHCEPLASGGSVHNLTTLQEGKVELGLARADQAHRAWFGRPPFKGVSENLRVLFALHQEIATLISIPEAQLNSFRDVPSKRVSPGGQGSDNEILLSDLLKSCALASAASVQPEAVDVAQSITALKNRSIDGFFSMVSHPNDDLKRFAQERAMLVLPLTDQCLKKYVGQRSYLESGSIPGGEYRGIDADVPSMGMRIWVFAHTGDDEAIVSTIVGAVFDHLEDLRKIHPALRRLSPRSMLPEFNIPYHNGALKYFAKRGWFVLEGK
ncbi:MAG: TAXI family TRAP transporter solute-binding subunit [Magnetococcales bacterium]|nr:TAXI family TRAP transporter solute-binding subunit [Magnetococcales bacterium]